MKNEKLTSAELMVLEYIDMRPLCERPDIVSGTGLGLSVVSTALTKLRRAGQIRANKVRKSESDKDKGRRMVRWEVGGEVEVKQQSIWIGQPRQKTVTRWTSDARRDPLTAALFGNPQQSNQTDTQ